MTRYSRAEVENTWNIEMAARQDKPFKAVGGIGSELYIVHAWAPREVSLPEPVQADLLNGRAPLEWEVPLIVAARTRERRLELALLAGCCGMPP